MNSASFASLLIIQSITIRRARTWLCRRMHRYGEQPNGSVTSLPSQSSADCIINTCGYDFGKDKSVAVGALTCDG